MKIRIRIIRRKRKPERTILKSLALLTAIICLTALVENPPKNLQETKVLKIAERKTVIVTAYSSTPDQTDSTPFITAWNTKVRDGIVACNFLPFGTKVLIPEYSGKKIFTVEDRMARRHKNRVDIWFPTREAAKVFGIQELEIIVLKD